ncbi:MAG: glycosyltransferase [Thermoleophilaceae bacterium]
MPITLGWMDRLAAQSRRIALVHDFLVDMRGAERVFLAMCDMWPHADVFSTIYDEAGTEGRFAGREVHTSFLQKMKPTARTFRALLPLYPAAIESFDFSGYDLVVSSSSAWAHALICDEATVHVCYCHNPFRYAWSERDATLAARNDPFSRAALRSIFRRWRQWDWIAAQRVDRYLANSHMTQARIRAYFGRDSTVVYPSVETRRFAPGDVSDYYMVLSELMPHKRIDVAIRAFNKLKQPLVIVGDGPDRRQLQQLAGPTISFAGRVSDSRVAQLLRGARALIVPAVEEFGIAAVEAQAAGRPVISARGGQQESVLDGITGVFFEGEEDELIKVVTAFDDSAVDPAECVANALRFDTAVFRERLPYEIARAVEDSERTPREELRVMSRRRRRARPHVSAD